MKSFALARVTRTVRKKSRRIVGTTARRGAGKQRSAARVPIGLGLRYGLALGLEI